MNFQDPLKKCDKAGVRMILRKLIVILADEDAAEPPVKLRLAVGAWSGP